MTPFNYPFNYDSVSYFGALARFYNQPTVWQGLQQIWGHSQAPTYFSIQLVSAKLFGFSYPHALYVQGAITLLLLVCLVPPTARLCRLWTGWGALCVAACVVSLFALSGYFNAEHGNLFEFRIDLVPALLFALALASWPRRNGWALFWTALAVTERFHLLPLVGVSVVVFAAFERKQLLRSIRFPALGISAAFILRVPYFYFMLGYYLAGHFGQESQIRGFSAAKAEFWTFYPHAFSYLYPDRATGYGMKGVLLLLLLASLLVSRGWDGTRKRILAWVESFLPLLAGGVIALPGLGPDDFG